MRKTLTIAFVLFAISLSAQTTLDSLKNRIWVDRSTESVYKYVGVAVLFSDSRFIIATGTKDFKNGKTDNLKTVCCCYYYLSDTKDDVFDEKKVGKIKNGKYVVYYFSGRFKSQNKEDRITRIYEVSKLDGKNLYLKMAKFIIDDGDFNLTIEGHVSDEDINNMKRRTFSDYKLCTTGEELEAFFRIKKILRGNLRVKYSK